MALPRKEDRAIFEAIRQGTAPTVVKRQAARGTLPLAAAELLEILVFLTNDPDPTCSETAQRALASWPVEKCAALLADPDISAEALAYFASQQQVPAAIVAAIARHPNAGDEALAPLATRLSLEQAEEITDNDTRLGEMPRVVAGLLQRHDLPATLRSRLGSLHGKDTKEQEELAATLAREEEAEAQAKPVEKQEGIGLVLKIARMTMAERVRFALKGSKEERMILIRDHSRLVFSAVLQAPKLTNSEVEAFASMRNVEEEVLRIIAGNRQFMKNYNVVRNLVNNPRTPIEISLSLLNRLINRDLKFLTKNRNVPEAVRITATKLHRERGRSRGGAAR